MLADRLPDLLKEAEARGDLYEATDLRIRISHAKWLAADEPERARQEVNDAIARWPSGEFYIQHWWSLIANVEISLYSGQGMAAWDLLAREWPRLKRSLLLRVQYIRIESLSTIVGRLRLASLRAISPPAGGIHCLGLPSPMLALFTASIWSGAPPWRCSFEQRWPWQGRPRECVPPALCR